MKVYIGADHRGFELKNKLKEWLSEQACDTTDCGNIKYDPLDDYVDFANCVAEKVIAPNVLGVVICGSGVGVSVAANRHKGIVCALGFDVDQVKHARENDSINVLSLPSDYVDFDKAREMITAFMSATPKTEEKYLRRLKKLDS